jgi:hypothetical protein
VAISPLPPQSTTSPAARNNGSVARSSALMKGPIRRRCTSHRDPGSHHLWHLWSLRANAAPAFGQNGDTKSLRSFLTGCTRIDDAVGVHADAAVEARGDGDSALRPFAVPSAGLT